MARVHEVHYCCVKCRRSLILRSIFRVKHARCPYCFPTPTGLKLTY